MANRGRRLIGVTVIPSGFPETRMSTSDIALPLLTLIEARILGCLIEKQKTTPDQYPLSLNALMLACNQKTNRDPIMDLSLGEIGHSVRELEQRELVERAFGGRVERYQHRFDQYYGLTLRKQALLGLLMLRGPQTLNELLIRSERLADFSDAEDLRHTLDRMIEQSPPQVVKLPRAGGQREDRYQQLLAVEAARAEAVETLAASAHGNAALADRVRDLETQVQALRAEIDAINARQNADSSNP